MSTLLKIVVAIIIIGAIVWAFMAYSQHSQIPTPNPATSTQIMNTQTAPSTQTAAATTATAPSDTSDAALSKDMSSIDVQMNTVSTNSAGIDQSLNDTPVQQGQ